VVEAAPPQRREPFPKAPLTRLAPPCSVFGAAGEG